MDIKVQSNFLTYCTVICVSNKFLHPKKNNTLVFPVMETRHNNLLFTFWKKWLCYSRLSVFATAKRFLNTWLVLWKVLDAILVRYATITTKPSMPPFHCQLPFVSTYLCEQGWISWAVKDKETPRLPPVSEIPLVPFESFALCFCLPFFSHPPNLFCN